MIKDMSSTKTRGQSGMVEKLNKLIISEIFDAIGYEIEERPFRNNSELVGYVVKRWVKYFNFYFDRVCLHCSRILTRDTIEFQISPRAFLIHIFVRR